MLNFPSPWCPELSLFVRVLRIGHTVGPGGPKLGMEPPFGMVQVMGMLEVDFEVKRFAQKGEKEEE